MLESLDMLSTPALAVDQVFRSMIPLWELVVDPPKHRALLPLSLIFPGYDLQLLQPHSNTGKKTGAKEVVLPCNMTSL